MVLYADTSVPSLKLVVSKLKEQFLYVGKTINEIREDIDNKYKDGGYPEPTDTKHYSA